MNKKAIQLAINILSLHRNYYHILWIIINVTKKIKYFLKQEGFFENLENIENIYCYWNSNWLPRKVVNRTLKVTDVRIRKITEEGKMKAIVSVTLDDEFVVHDIKIIDGQNGLFIAMPSRKMADGEFRDIAHPINAETRKKIQDAIFQEYEKVLASESN